MRYGRRCPLCHCVQSGYILFSGQFLFQSLSHDDVYQKAMFFLTLLEATSTSQRVFWTPSKKLKYLTYTNDANNNRIPHFSYVGFKHGNYSKPITSVLVTTLYPPKGDATAYIQNAINAMASKPLDVNGFRGTILLKKGTWYVANTIYPSISGVVIQGEGNGADPTASTVIVANGVNSGQSAVFYVGNSNINWYASNAQTLITSQFVGLSAFKFQVQSVGGYKIGQSILIVYPANQAWLNSVNRGGTYSDTPWGLGFPNVCYLRKITFIDPTTNTMFIDSPTFEKMDASISQPYIIPFDDSKVVKNVIIRNLNIQIVSAIKDPQDQNHAQNGIIIDGSEDVWVYKCTISGFVRSGVVTYTSTRVSVTETASVDPIGQDTTDNFYNFSVERNSQLILFAHNFARGGRHQYVVNGMATASGVVFFDSTSINPSAVDESHRGWSTGILYDYMCNLN